MIARRIGTILFLLGLACSPLAFSVPAEAGDSGVQVSTTPTGPFRDQLHRQLFAGAGKLVPGDRVTRTFYVRNDSDLVARTTLEVSDSGPRNGFSDALDVSADLGGVSTDGPLHTGDPDCSLTVTGPNLAPGAVQAVDITVDFRDVVGTAAAAQRASLDLLVTLSQVGETGVVEVCGEQATSDPVDDDPLDGGPDDGTNSDPRDDGDARCDQGAVVTVAGNPSCVPTSVAAGAHEGGPTEPTVREQITRSAIPALLLLGLGGGLVIGAWPMARRRSQDG